MNTKRIRITDLGGQETTTYVAHSEADCQDSTDASAYREAVRLQDVITMGKIIAEPMPEHREPVTVGQLLDVGLLTPANPDRQPSGQPPVTVGQMIDAGLMTPYETRSNAHRALFETVADKANWKLPTNAKTCATRAEAQALADAITWFVGGAEINHDNTVLSRGYYFYIGA